MSKNCLSFAGAQSVPGLQATFGKYSGYFKAYGYPWASVTHMWGVYLMVLVTLQRYIAVCVPLKAKTWASVKAAQVETVCLFFGAIIFYSPRFWQRQVYFDATKGIYNARYTDFGTSYGFHMVYMIMIYYVVIYIIPLSLLVFTTYKLIKSLKKVKDRKKAMTSSSQSSSAKDEITFSLIIVVAVFGISQLANPVSFSLLFLVTTERSGFVRNTLLNRDVS